MLLSWVWWEQRAGALAGGLWPWLLQPPGPTAQPVACVSPEALSAPVFPHRGSPPKDQGQGGVKVPFSYPQKLQKSKLGLGGGSQPHLTGAEPEAQSWLGGGALTPTPPPALTDGAPTQRTSGAVGAGPWAGRISGAQFLPISTPTAGPLCLNSGADLPPGTHIQLTSAPESHWQNPTRKLKATVGLDQSRFPSGAGEGQPGALKNKTLGKEPTDGLVQARRSRRRNFLEKCY